MVIAISYKRLQNRCLTSLQFKFYDTDEGNNGIKSYIPDEMIWDWKYSQMNQANEVMDQPHEQDKEIGYEESTSPATYEGLEHKFIDEIMKLTRDRSDAEDAEFARHKEVRM